MTNIEDYVRYADAGLAIARLEVELEQAKLQGRRAANHIPRVQAMVSPRIVTASDGTLCVVEYVEGTGMTLKPAKMVQA